MAKKVKDGLRLKGFFRVAIEQDGKIVGDSGLVPNTIMDLGLTNFAVGGLVAAAGSSAVAYAAIGSGGTAASAATALPSECLLKRTGFGATAWTQRANSTGQGTLQINGTFVSGSANVVAVSAAINNIGLFAGSATGAGTMFCGTTFTQSTVSSNQNINYTYQILIG